MKKSKQAKAREFSEEARARIYYRDRGQCIFCMQQYEMTKATWFSQKIMSVMHFIPRSHNGLGIEENGAIGCQYHHEMMDNGNNGKRKEMLEIFEQYLREHYEDWNKEKLVYSKWGND